MHCCVPCLRLLACACTAGVLLRRRSSGMHACCWRADQPARVPACPLPARCPLPAAAHNPDSGRSAAGPCPMAAARSRAGQTNSLAGTALADPALGALGCLARTPICLCCLPRIPLPAVQCARLREAALAPCCAFFWRLRGAALLASW